MTPLYSDRVTRALQANQARFRAGEEAASRNIEWLRNELNTFLNLSVADIESILVHLEDADESRFGARPTWEHDQMPFVLPFAEGRDWPHHHSARQWAARVLEKVTTFAADGSVIEPSGDMSVSVGLVQIGWYENPHNSTIPYVKDVSVEVVLPEDLRVDAPGVEIAWRRYQGETKRAIAFMKAHAGQRGAVAFLDGTLTISFVRGMTDSRQAQYHACINELLDVSEQTRVPAVGYVDSSDSIDFLGLMMSAVKGSKVGYENLRPMRATDAGLLAFLQPRMLWGERCRAYICDRDDGVTGNDYYRDRICFTYLQTAQQSSPARLEIPRWVFDDHDLFEWVLDVVRAECVVGVGYPYPLETADAVAVLSGPDRERFYRLFQSFAADNGIPVRYKQKPLSKRGRRL